MFSVFACTVLARFAMFKFRYRGPDPGYRAWQRTAVDMHLPDCLPQHRRPPTAKDTAFYFMFSSASLDFALVLYCHLAPSPSFFDIV
jgi:hypothetical protein